MSEPQQPTCRVIRAVDTYDGKQGLTYFCGIAAETVGSKAICMHLLTVPPGAASWVCSAPVGSSCPASGSDDIDVFVDLAPNATLSFLLSATVPATPEQPVSSTVTLVVPGSVVDPAMGNNSAADGPDAVGVFADGFE